MSATQSNTSLHTLLEGLRAQHKETEAAFEQLNKAVDGFLLGAAIDPEALDALVDRCECAYVEAAADADEVIRALLHVHTPLPGMEEPMEQPPPEADPLACYTHTSAQTPCSRLPPVALAPCRA